MPVGIVGRQVDVAFARSNSWSVPASVTQQVLMESTAGRDAQQQLTQDESFNQDFLGIGEMGDTLPVNADLSMQFRFEQGPDVFLAAAMGSAAAPTTVSSQAANSLVAYSHVVTMSPALSHFFTIATDFVQYVQELRTAKVRGFTITVGEMGRMMVSYQLVGDKTVYNSTTNTNSTVAGATPATPGNTAFRKDMRFRMNLQSAGSLTSSDAISIAREITFKAERTMGEDFVLGSDAIIEADDDGFWDGELDVTFAAMNTVSANSLVTGFQAGTVWKGDLQFLGTYINSSAANTRREYLFQMPALQVDSSGFKAEAAGHGRIRPEVKFKLRMPDSAPTGMSGVTQPLRVTVVNTRSANLLA